ncbi:hypothetical protein GA0115236_13827, partial [Streptomyces sp. IgraMP-1]
MSGGVEQGGDAPCGGGGAEHQGPAALQVPHGLRGAPGAEGDGREARGEHGPLEGRRQAVARALLEQDVGGQFTERLAEDRHARLQVGAGAGGAGRGGPSGVGLRQLRQDLHAAGLAVSPGDQPADPGQFADGLVQLRGVARPAYHLEHQPKAEGAPAVVLLVAVLVGFGERGAEFGEREPEDLGLVRWRGGVERLRLPPVLPGRRHEFLHRGQPLLQPPAPLALRGQGAVQAPQFGVEPWQVRVVLGAPGVVQFAVGGGEREGEGERGVGRHRAVPVQPGAQFPQPCQGGIRVVEVAAVLGGLLQDADQVGLEGDGPPGAGGARLDALPEEPGGVVEVTGVAGAQGEEHVPARDHAPLAQAGVRDEVPQMAVEIRQEAGIGLRGDRPLGEAGGAVAVRRRRGPFHDGVVGGLAGQCLPVRQQVGVEPRHPG